MSGRDTFADNGTTGILTQMNHLRTRIRLLVIIRHRHTVEFSRGIISSQNAGGYFHVIADPVSTCVQESLLFAPLQLPRFVTKL